jgi:GDP-mannose pyrophosphatase NudK
MQPLLILIAGPYRSGTDDQPERIARNLHMMNETAYAVYQRGHLPVCGEWFALPLIEQAGSQRLGDEPFNAIFHPVSVQILNRCDAVLRVGGPSVGADEMVRVAQQAGKLVFTHLAELP